MSAGSFVAANYQATEQLYISTGLLYDYTSSSESDFNSDYSQLVPGMSIVYQLTEMLSVNLFGMYHAMFNLHEELDDSYYDAGVELSFNAGSWGLALTAKKSFDLDHYEVTEFHLGSVFRW